GPGGGAGSRGGGRTALHSLGAARATVGDRAGADGPLGQSPPTFGERSGSPGRIPPPVNIAEMPGGGSGARPAMWVVFEDTLQPFAELSCDTAAAYVLANRAGIARRLGDLDAARTMLDEAEEQVARVGDVRVRAYVLGRRTYH